MTTVLLTLGRLPKALELARALTASGCRVLVAEPFSRHLTGASRAVERSFVVTAPAENRERYLDELGTIIARERVDIVVPVSEEILYVSLLQGRVPRSTRVFSMPTNHLLSVYDKHGFVARCREAGIAAPVTFELGEEGAALLAARAATVVKPIYSCSGRGVQFLPAGAALPRLNEPAVVQQFVSGRLISTFGLARQGEVKATVVYRGVTMQGTVAVCFERIELTPAVSEWIAKFVAATRFDGFVSFDLIIDDDGQVWGIECNPRTTSGIHFVAAEDLARAVLDPAAVQGFKCKPQTLLQQFYPALTETQSAMFGADFTSKLRNLWQARDVSWQLSDPWPFIGMPWSSWPIISRALRAGCSFGEVAMLDFSWPGRVPAAGVQIDAGALST